ncbi:MAG: carbonic anhydrase [Coriobacteriia bacterium]|nr:carbonic anhydrase [Coriobacteriia bacterium]
MSFSSDKALQLLRDGNRRFAEGRPVHRFSAEERAAVVEGQKPWAVIVGCSDSRVPVETVFDAGVGELFVVRCAGNVIGKVGFASARFAIEVLGAQTLVVLGHERCGAVEAALSGSAPAWLEPVTSAIHLHEDCCESLTAVEYHIRESVTTLRDRLAAAGVEPVPLVIGGVYELASGEIRWLD